MTSAHAHTPGDRVEDPVIRQYRFLLRTAPLDALEAAHVEALTPMAPEVRAAVLSGVQEGSGEVGDLDCDGTQITYVLTGSVQNGSPQLVLQEPAPNTD